ncbi:MAG TPA: hypothetical protein VKZ79_01600 [Alphaproteobacteria bacterium]|nr:hypothetical protein [Alphaproteobacteria bacterium]
MAEDLKKLVELAKAVRMTAPQVEEQRRSFAYGNTAIENPRITKELINQQAEALQASRE